MNWNISGIFGAGVGRHCRDFGAYMSLSLLWIDGEEGHILIKRMMPIVY